MTAPAARTCVLLCALLLAPAGAARAENSLPDFNLNAKKVSSVCKYSEDRVPPVPPPTDTGYYARYGGEGARLDSSVTVVVQEKAGRAEILFPRAKNQQAAGYRSALFVKLDGEGAAPVLSWAAVFCSGGRYLGYKGSSLAFAPDGDFHLKDEALALGPLKVRLVHTHPWIMGGLTPDALCSADLPKTLGYTVKALPAQAYGLGFSYDRRGNALTVTWQAK